MTAVLLAIVLAMAAALAGVTALHFRYRSRPPRVPVAGTRRILFPFLADALSSRALDAALRMANAESATVVPVFLARVPLQLPLDTPLPRQSAIAIPMQEAIEHRAVAFGVPVDARIERGRTNRHALRQAIVNERFDRIVISAAAHGSAGFEADDVAWLLDNAPGEIAVLRPGDGEQLIPPRRRGIGFGSRRTTERTKPDAGSQFR